MRRSYQRILDPGTRKALLGAVLLVIACGGATAPVGSSAHVSPGAPCLAAGTRAPAKDGCNTCTCENGGWTCTEMACVDAGSSAGGATGGTGGAAGASGAPPVVCADGSTTSPDGCNTCTCLNGAWACTTRACPPPPACAEGSVSYQPCTTCVCTGGQWACTGDCVDAGAQAGCGGWLLNTCAPDEYCAYQEGAACGGATDASALCEPRPTGCSKEYDPVCGCDGKTYGNACMAAMNGPGVMSSGLCPSGA